MLRAITNEKKLLMDRWRRERLAAFNIKTEQV